MATSSISAMLAIVVGLIQVSVILSCSCNVKHPQTQFKEANFVIKAKIVAKHRGQAGPDMSLPVTTYTEYQVKVERIFKGKRYIHETMAAIFMPEEGSCSIRQMKPGKKYLISGYYEDNAFYIDECSWVEQWEKLSREQKRGLKATYAAKCRKCNVPSVSGPELIMRIGPQGITDTAPEPHLTSLSGLWTTEPGRCAFNPVDSWQYLHNDADCETLYTYCMRDAGSEQKCGWQINNVYKDCFIDRETAWAKHEISRTSMRGRSMRLGNLILGCSHDLPEDDFNVCLRREVASFVTRFLPPEFVE